VVTGKLLAACLVAFESFTKEDEEEEDDNQKINELSKNQIIV
jgi:hypothetical protein